MMLKNRKLLSCLRLLIVLMFLTGNFFAASGVVLAQDNPPGDGTFPAEEPVGEGSEGDETPTGEGDEAPGGEGDEAPGGEGDEAPTGEGDEAPTGEGDEAPGGEGEDESTNEESIPEIIDDALENDIILADENGDPMPLANEDTVLALAEGDPTGILSDEAAAIHGVPGGTIFQYFPVSGGHADGDCEYNLGTLTCYFETPVQKAVNDAQTNTTIIIAAGSYHEEVTIEREDLTLAGHGGDAILDKLIIKANVGNLSHNVYAPIVIVFPTANIQDGVMLVQQNGTVQVVPGEYFGEIEIDKPMILVGDVGDPSIAGAAQDAPKIVPENNFSDSYGIKVTSNSSTTIQGFIIDGFKKGILVGTILDSANGTNINNNTIRNNGQGVVDGAGIYVYESTHTIANYNAFSGNNPAIYNYYGANIENSSNNPSAAQLQTGDYAYWVNAQNNYWGCNGAPGTPGCQTVGGYTKDATDPGSWGGGGRQQKPAKYQPGVVF